MTKPYAASYTNGTSLTHVSGIALCIVYIAVYFYDTNADARLVCVR